MNPLSPSGNKTRAYRLQIWIIVNPTSGHGKGLNKLNRIIRSLSKGIFDGVVYRRTASEVVAATSTYLSEETNEDVTLASFWENSSENADPAQLFVTHKRLRIDVITTEETISGFPLSEHIARAVVGTRIEQCRRNGFAKTLHIFVPIGGDGTMNDVINGMCRGTLRAFREAFSQDSAQDEFPVRACTSTSLDASTLKYWTFMEEKAVLNYLMPPLIYVSAGTGNDFSKLQLCCRDEVEFISVIKGICADMWTPDLLSSFARAPSSEELNSTCSNHASEHDKINTLHPSKTDITGHTDSNTEAKTDKEHSFAVYDVDIGRVSFPRSGNHCFFINECSCGMSCDVIQRCDQYKKSKVMSMAGGSVMFALASLVSVVKMRPKPLRVMPLPDTAVLPSDELPGYRNYASPFIPSHVLFGDLALRGLSKDLCFIDESMRSASIPANDPLVVGADYYAYSSASPDSTNSRKDSNGRRDSSDSRRDCGNGKKDRSNGEKDSSDSRRDSSDSRRDRSNGRRDSSDSRRDCSNGRRDSSDSRRDRSNGRRDSSDSRRDRSNGKKDSSDSRRDSCNGRRDSSDSRRDRSNDRRDRSNSSSRARVNSFFSARQKDARATKKSREILDAVAQSASDGPNGRWVHLQSSTLVFANGRWFGGGLQIAPHGNPTDQRLSVTNWVAGFFRFVSGATSLYNGKHAKWSSTTLWTSQRSIVDSGYEKVTKTGKLNKHARTEKIEVHCETDGELKEQLPAVVEICGAVKIIVPKRRVGKRVEDARVKNERKKYCAVL